MAVNDAYQHWDLVIDADGIAWAWFDKADNAVNTIDRLVLSELEAIIQFLVLPEQLTHIIGLVIASKKTSGFIAGADIEQFKQAYQQNESSGLELIHYGQAVFNSLEQFPKPTVAMISGFCVGGGLELALACQYRVAEDQTSTRLGLPEVLLGIHPGWGGTVRLPRLIGGLNAMPLILSGKTVNARKAYQLGLVNFAVPKRQLVNSAVFCIQQKNSAKKLSIKKHRGLLNRFSNIKLFRQLLARIMRKQVARKANIAHYPAPYKAIEQWCRHGVANTAYQYEAISIAQLFMTSTAQNLIRVFFLQTQLKSLANKTRSEKNSKPIDHVHVIGAGIMGGDIAAWCALNQIKVTLQDREFSLLAPALQRANKLFKKILKKNYLVQAAYDRLIPDVKGDGVASADLIIEAIFEDPKAKQELFAQLEKTAKPEAIFATNTSSIPLASIYPVLKNPARLVGIHFFNPVAKMQLVEVVRDSQTSESIYQQALCFVKQIKRLPLPVKSSPGFVINRILMPYLLESVCLIEEGYSKELIDHAATQFGMPMGPIRLADAVGLDVCCSVAQELIKHFQGELPACLTNAVAQKHLGQKTQRGFYDYKKGKPIYPKKQQFPKDIVIHIQQRLIYRLLNEAMACLRAGIIEQADLLDAGMIFGTGFAPFRGGPMQYARSIGKTALLEQFAQLSDQYGKRFQADSGWHDFFEQY